MPETETPIGHVEGGERGDIERRDLRDARAERERPFFDTYGLPPISDTLPDIG